MRFCIRILAAAIFVVLLSPMTAGAQNVRENGDKMSEALAAVDAKDWASAAHIASAIRDPMASEIVTWLRLRAGEGDWSEYVEFLARNPDWPGLKRLRRASEGVMPRGLTSALVRAHFQAEPPQTGRGVLRLGAALKDIGRTGEARSAAIRAWVELSLNEDEELALLRDYGGALARHHEERLDQLLWRGLTREAQRMLPRVSTGSQALAKARIALRRGSKGVDALITAVPRALQDHPGLAYERFIWRIKKERWDDAEAFLTEQTRAGAELGRPEYWAQRRRGFARRAMRRGAHQAAYLLAQQHQLTPQDGYAYADLEWLAGYISLRFFKKPEQALRHFRNFQAAVATPISLGRSGYWLGRAYEEAGRQVDAIKAYSLGATYQSSFYGQLSAERAGLPADSSLVGTSEPGSWKGAAFLNSTVFRAGLLLHYADEPIFVRWFFSHMAETMTSVDQSKLAQVALDIERPHAALRIAKEAAKSAHVIAAPYYPVTELAHFGVEIPPELAMAIARQESELNPAAISPVGARGLMQIMPATARRVAKQVGTEYSKARLTSDWRYNARLGIAYLSGLLEDYNGSIVLAAAAYNAGPSRVNGWIAEYGDPRRDTVDQVDWIENIPYRETRNYVQRVLESLHVYRLRINGRAEPLRLALELSKG